MKIINYVVIKRRSFALIFNAACAHTARSLNLIESGGKRSRTINILSSFYIYNKLVSLLYHSRAEFRLNLQPFLRSLSLVYCIIKAASYHKNLKNKIYEFILALRTLACRT